MARNARCMHTPARSALMNLGDHNNKHEFIPSNISKLRMFSISEILIIKAVSMKTNSLIFFPEKNENTSTLIAR